MRDPATLILSSDYNMLIAGQTIFNSSEVVMKHTRILYKATLILLAFTVLLISLAGCQTNQPENSGQGVGSLPVSLEDGSTTIGQPLPTSTTYVDDHAFAAPDWFADYPSILGEYRRFVDYSIAGGYQNVRDNDVFGSPVDISDLAEHWSNMEIELNIPSSSPLTRSDFGYALKDLNGDGTPELILLYKDYYVLAIFTTVEGSPKLLDAYWGKYVCVIFESGLICALGTGGAFTWTITTQEISIENGGLQDIEQYGHDREDTISGNSQYYYRIIDGERCHISEAEYLDFTARLQNVDFNTAKDITRDSGITFIPLFD